MDDEPFNKDPVYLFVQDPIFSAAENQVCLPGMFCAWDPQGKRRLTDGEFNIYLAQIGLTLDDLVFEVSFLEYASWEQYQYGIVREVHSRLGFNPDSRDVSDFLGYPPIEIDTEVLASLAPSRCTLSFQHSSTSIFNVVEIFVHSWIERGIR